MLQTILTAILCYTSTNIDDLFLLTLLCAQADSKAGQRSILTGHCLGIGALTAVSLLGAFGLQFIAAERLTRLLGLIPILLGIRSWRQTQSDDAPSPSRATLGTSGIFLLTVANGADNVGVYIPAFSRSSPLQLGVTFLLFALLCLVWWLLAERFAAYPLLQRKLQQYQHILVPLVLIAIGLSVLLG